MSAPPLPETFGNYALGDFVEVVAPADISWLPQTAGWAWLGLLILALALRAGWRWLMRWHRNRYRREAVARLQALSSDSLGERLVAEVNKLLKLAAMAAYSRERVARLYGEQWTGFLKQQCPTQPFTDEQAELLAVGAYQPSGLDAEKALALIEASMTWVREHRDAGNG